MALDFGSFYYKMKGELTFGCKIQDRLRGFLISKTSRDRVLIRQPRKGTQFLRREPLLCHGLSTRNTKYSIAQYSILVRYARKYSLMPSKRRFAPAIRAWCLVRRLLADTKAPEYFAQQIVAAELAGNFAERTLCKP
jgi:hypothetical protein